METEFIDDLDALVGRLDRVISLRRAGDFTAGKVLDHVAYRYSDAELARLRALDPFGPEFLDSQMALFRRIAGKDHDILDEGLDTFGDIANGLPFYMAPEDVGYWMVIYGHILQKLALPKGARVLEVGFGPGGLTELLVRAGLDVVAVDPNESNCEFVHRRVGAFGGRVTTLAKDLVSAEISGPLDAVIFFESFHHILDFKPVLEKCAALLKPTGFFVFAAEPIVPDDHPHVPLPWCIRTAGHAFCALREESWIELGFQETFFNEMMAGLGFGVEKTYILNYHHSEIRICRRSSGTPASPPRLPVGKPSLVRRAIGFIRRKARTVLGA